MVGQNVSEDTPRTGAASSREMIFVFLLGLIALLVFGLKSEKLGMYFDDSGFMIYHDRLPFFKVFEFAAYYLPGRNLHIVWQYAFYNIFGGDIDGLPGLHWFQAAASTVVALMLYGLLRILGCAAAPAFVGAAVFAFYPNHTEVQFWPSAMPMNVMSTALVMIFLISLASLVRSGQLLVSSRRRAIAVLGSVSAALAMFTYDQPVLLIMFCAFVGGIFLFLQRRENWKLVAIIWTVCGVTFLGNIFAKLRDPANGPNFGHVNLTHILSNVWASIHSSFGNKFWSVLFTPDLVAAVTLPAVLLALLGAAIIAAGIIYLKAGAEARHDWHLHWHPMVIILAGVCIFFLSYSTNYLWYIATRHNYLPSLGIAIGVAGIVALVLRPRRGRTGMGFARPVVAAVIGVLSGVFILNTLAAKELWISSYQVRKNFYNDVVNRVTLGEDSILVLWGFPRYFGQEIAVFAHEKRFVVWLITRKKGYLRELLEGAVPGRGILFYNTEIEKDQLNTFRYLKTQKYFLAEFKSLADDKVVFDFSEREAVPEHAVEPYGSPANSGEEGPKANVVSFVVPDTTLGDGEVLAALPMIGQGGSLSPATVKQPNDYSTLMLNEIPCEKSCSGRYRLTDPRLPEKVAAVYLFAVSQENPPRLLGRVPVDQPPSQ
jgi:hypothetical protein